MRFSNILLATDFSPHADHAGDVAIALAQAVGGLRRLLTGSVAEAVIRRTPIPVLAVRLSDDSRVAEAAGAPPGP
jgi:nucleotide-binding universal stress UspA family protein